MRMVVLILLSLSATFVGCGEKPKTPKGNHHSSPEAMFAAHVCTREQHDWRKFYETLSPGQKDKQILEFVSAILSDKTGEIAVFLDKYTDKKRAAALTKSTDLNTLSVEERSRLFAPCITDKKRMFVEINMLMDEQDIERLRWCALRNVVHQARRAKGLATLTYVFEWSETKAGESSVMRRETRQFEQPVYFIKQDGKWLFATQQEWENAK